MRKAAGAVGQTQAISINYATHTWGEMNVGRGSIPNPATITLMFFGRTTVCGSLAPRSSMARPPT